MSKVRSKLQPGRIKKVTSAIPFILKDLKHKNLYMRSIAASALGDIGDSSAVPYLQDALKDEDDWVRTSAAYALGQIKDRSAIPSLIEALKEVRGLPDLRLAHRLDRDTSGVLLMAKNLEALRRLTESFRERDMQKTYFALVAGHPFAHAGRMQSKLAKGVVRGGERMVIDSEEGKEAITDFQVMIQYRKNDFDYAMLALKPHSGRTHQLRVQLQNEGNPILGDNKYAGKDELSAYKSLKGRGLMLHAWRLRFNHPVTGTSLEFKAPWPDNWMQLLQG